jgi:hypothetical protein
MKTLARAFVLLALLAAPFLAHALAQDLGPQAPLPASKDLYSFADLYRLAAGGAELPAPWGAAEPSGDVQFRVRTVGGGAAGATQAAAYVFSTSRVTQPQGGLLLLAGLASVLWVARRRLGLPIRR